MIDYLYAELTDNVPDLDYTGITTTTAKVLIDDEERSIGVDVLKLPHSITFNNEVFDGSEDKVFTVDLSNYYTKDETYNKEEVDYLLNEKQNNLPTVSDANKVLTSTGINSYAWVDNSVKYLAPAYSSLSTYNIDDLCVYNNKLYKCIATISVAESWNSAHWTETTIVESVLGLLNTGI